MSGNDRICLLVLILISAAHALLLSAQRILPFVDVPHHLAAAVVVRNYDRPDNQFRRYYRIDTRLRPNLVHLVFCSSGVFDNAEQANRAFYCLYVFFWPLSVFLLIKSLGGRASYCLLSFLLIYSFCVSFGFCAYTMALPLTLVVYAYMVFVFGRSAGDGHLVLLSFCIVAVFFAHVIASLFLALCLLLFCLLYRNKRGLLCLVPFLLLFAYWLSVKIPSSDTPTHVWLFRYYLGTALSEYPSRIFSLLFLDNLELVGIGRSACFIGILAVYTMTGLLRAGRGPQKTLTDAAGNDEIRFGLKALGPLLIGAASCFFFLPNELPRFVYLYTRFSVLLLVGLIALASLRARGGASATLIFTLLALAHLALCYGYMEEWKRQTADFSVDLFPMPGNDTIVGGMVLENKFRRLHVFEHLPEYNIVWKKGISPANLFDCRFSPLSKAVPETVLPRYWTITRKEAYDGRYDCLSHILVRGEIPPEIKTRLGRFVVDRRRGAWLLLRRKDRKKD